MAVKNNDKDVWPKISGAHNNTWPEFLDENRAHLSSFLLSAMKDWEGSIPKCLEVIPPESKEVYKEQCDKIEAAADGMVSDLHNLAINYHLMTDIIKNNEYKDNGLRELYIGLLMENYVTNIRSIYDFCSVFPRILMSIDRIKKYTTNNGQQSDSLYRLIQVLDGKNPANLAELPDSMKTLIKNAKDQLDIVREIRDAIVHKGNEPFVQFNADDAVFRLPEKYPNDKTNKCRDILQLGDSAQDYPLFKYLRKLTLDLFDFMENMGYILCLCLCARKESHPAEPQWLDNPCMERFNEFVRYDLKSLVEKYKTATP